MIDLGSKFVFEEVLGKERDPRFDAVQQVCKQAADSLNELLPDGDEKNRTIKHLEEAMFWAVSGIASLVIGPCDICEKDSK